MVRSSRQSITVTSLDIVALRVVDLLCTLAGKGK